MKLNFFSGQDFFFFLKKQAFKLLTFSLGWWFVSFNNKKHGPSPTLELAFPDLFVKIQKRIGEVELELLQ